MTCKHIIAYPTIDAVRVHPLYYHTAHGAEYHRNHLLGQLRRFIAVTLLSTKVALTAFAPAQNLLIHLCSLSLVLAIIIYLLFEIMRLAKAKSKIDRYEKLKKNSVVYTFEKRMTNDEIRKAK